MKVTDVRAVIAIGLRGQFGLRGRLPWEGNRGRGGGSALLFRLHRRSIPELYDGQYLIGAVLCGRAEGASRHPARNRHRPI